MPVMLGAAAIGAAGGIASSLIGSNAAKNAANIQAQSAQNALNFQQGVFNQQQSNYNNASDYIKSTLSPYINAGYGATSTLSRLTGGNATPADYSSFYNSPDYQFALQQGTRGVTNYENAQGMGLSGGALKDISQFNQGLATQQYGNYFNRLMQLSQLGSGSANSAASGIGSLTGGFNNTAANMSNSIGNTIQGVGQAQASGVVGSANATIGGINSGVNNSLLSAALFSNPSAYKNLTGGFGSIFGGGNSGGAAP